jgi:hypothetical protein
MQVIRSIIKNILPYGISNHIIRQNEIRREPPSSEEPPVYNADGQKLKTIFLSDDTICRHNPYNFVHGRYPRNILWDRNNYGLKNHVYVHKNIISPMGKPRKRFALFIESEIIVPHDYKIFDMHKGLEKDFDLIFTHSAQFLDRCKNAVFIPGGGVYYGTQLHGGNLNPEQYKAKSRNASIVSSAKKMCELHKFRLSLAQYYKKSALVDAYGTFDGGAHIKIADALEHYRYSIVLENDITPYRFTEKILDCFASMTVPIYIGATKINDFFNGDGIIPFGTFDFNTIDKIISNCDEKDYLSRLPAILDNFNRVKDFLCIEDYMYTHYKENFV